MSWHPALLPPHSLEGTVTVPGKRPRKHSRLVLALVLALAPVPVATRAVGAGAPVEERAELGGGGVVGVVSEEGVAPAAFREEDAVAAVRVLGVGQVAVLELCGGDGVCRLRQRWVMLGLVHTGYMRGGPGGGGGR